MKKLLSRTGIAVLLSAVIFIGVAVAAVSFVTSQKQEATVTRIIDGDTIDVSLAGNTVRIRLLNIDTPEMDEPECLSLEAKQFLEQKIPAGTTIKLGYDAERTDRYDRTLAAVFLGDELINSSLARAGLGKAVVFGKNSKYLNEVQEAEHVARAEKLGIHGDVPQYCAIADEFVTAIQGLQKAQQPAPETIAAVDNTMAGLVTAVAVGDRVTKKIAGLGARERNALRHMLRSTSYGVSDLGEARKKAAGKHAGLKKKRAALVKAQKEAQRKKKAAERRKAAAAKKEAARKKMIAEQKRLAAIQRQRPAVPRPPQQYRPKPPPPPAPAPAQQYRPKPPPPPQQYRPQPAPKPANPYPGYNGPRCYAPGGKTWKPCPRKG